MSTLAALEPAKTAILAMDFQASILGFLPDPAGLLATAHDAITAVRRAGGLVGYVRVAFEPEEVNLFPPHSPLGQRIKAAGAKMLADSSTTAVHAALAPQPHDIIVRKTRVGAFSTTLLDRRLRGAGIDTLVLTGVHTGGVVLTTAREAHDLDYRVIILADACADPEPETHAFLLDKIFPRQAEVCTVADLKSSLRTA